MEKHFKYSPSIQFSKILVMIMMVLIPLTAGWLLLPPSSLSPEEYKIVTTASVLGTILCAYTIGSISDVKTDADGLHINFFWKYLFVPWKEIKGIKYIGFRSFGYWVILTNNSLTIFHRLYSIGTLPIYPSFQVHKNMESRETLLSMIRKKMPKSNRNST